MENGQTESIDIPTTEKVEVKKISTGKAFSAVKRELSDDDLKNPAIGRMLLDEIDKLSQQNVVLESLRDSYHAADKRAEVCEQISKENREKQLIYSIAQTIGGAVFGSAFSFPSPEQQGLFWLLILVGVILVGGTFLIILFSKKK